MKEFVMQETEEMTTFGSVWKRYEPVAELVRCKDCRFGVDRIDEPRNPCIKCERHPLYHFLEWFCADGERKDS